jgi:NAD(P)-dependent dehydrogenase (short-subunit alcohol dehydrogenase family)
MKQGVAGAVVTTRTRAGNETVSTDGAFDGRVAVVTGAAGSIGSATARLLAQRGAHVVVADIDEAGGTEVVKAIVEAGHRASFERYDVRDISDRHRFVEKVVHDLGALDVLVNNAGHHRRTVSVLDLDEEDWDYCFGLNSRGLFFLLQAAAARMSAQSGGAIVNLASIAGKGFRQTSNLAYAASKAAVIGLTRVAALQLAPMDVRVNAVCPGPTRSAEYHRNIEARAAAQGISVEDAWAAADAMIPIGRSNDPIDIARTICYLASDEARHVTGQSWNVDGGLLWD